MKAASPLLGFNNNVKHKGRVFHIQTEDSGIKHPHIITHLFADGGRILKTTKTSYAEHIGADSMAETVRGMMQEQHKAMFIALRDGQFDHLFEDIVRQAAQRSAPTAPEAPPAAPIAPPAAPIAPIPIAAAKPVESPVLVSPLTRSVSPTATTQALAAQGPAPAAGAPIDLDLDALERAAAEAQTPFFQQIHDLPPPPATVFGGGKRPGSSPNIALGTYRTVTPQLGTPTGPASANPGHRRTPVPPPPVEATKPPIPPASGSQPGSPGRYAPSRPAAIFANARPAEGASIFGEELISEKSLDEVILSYLAEDLDAPPQKK